MKYSLFIGTLLSSLALACGGPGSDLSADIQPTGQQARESLVGLMPVLDFSEVIDASVAERVLVDEIVLNVFDVRLLGLDPRIPTGGLRLIDTPEVVSLTREMQDAIGFEFPEYLEREDLAVYLNISPGAELDGASVIVRGRLYSTSVPESDEHRTHSLVAGPDHGEGAVDPDGEPAAPVGEGAVDPDGEPAAPVGEGAVDPDGEPADCAPDQRCQGLASEEANAYVSFELQSDQVVELQAGFGTEAALNVVLSIPAVRWFTPDAVAALDALLLSSDLPVGEVVDQKRTGTQAPGHMVLRDQRMGQLGAASSGTKDGDRLPEGDYSLRPGDRLGPDGTRGW